MGSCYMDRNKRIKKVRKIRKLVGLIWILAAAVICILLLTGFSGNKAMNKDAIVSIEKGWNNDKAENHKEEVTMLEKIPDILDVKEEVPEHIMDIKGMSQDGIPTGCEAVSATAALNYLGVKIQASDFIDIFLPKESFYYVGKALYGGNPEEVFAGSPFDPYSLGCFPPVIVKAVNRMKETGYKGCENINVEDISGMALEDIGKVYIANDIPVLIWITADMRKPRNGTTYYLDDNSKYNWKAGEHCMVLCGYDEESYYFLDSLKGGEMVSYEKEIVENIYKEMGKRAVGF